MKRSIILLTIALLVSCGGNPGGTVDSFYVSQLPGASILVDGVSAKIERPSCAHNDSEMYQCGIVTGGSDKSIDRLLGFNLNKAVEKGTIVVKDHGKEVPNDCENRASVQFVDYLQNRSYDDCRIGASLEFTLEDITEKYIQISLEAVLVDPGIARSDDQVKITVRNVRVGRHTVE